MPLDTSTDTNWPDIVADLHISIEKATSHIAGARHVRATRALAAARGDETARGEIAEAEKLEQSSRSIIDSANLALAEAMPELAKWEAERLGLDRDRKAARLASLKIQRTEAARTIDQAFATASAALGEYDRMGAEITALMFDIQPNLPASVAEGLRRQHQIAAAVPPRLTEAVRSVVGAIQFRPLHHYETEANGFSVGATQ